MFQHRLRISVTRLVALKHLPEHRQIHSSHHTRIYRTVSGFRMILIFCHIRFHLR